MKTALTATGMAVPLMIVSDDYVDEDVGDGGDGAGVVEDPPARTATHGCAEVTSGRVAWVGGNPHELEVSIPLCPSWSSTSTWSDDTGMSTG